MTTQIRTILVTGLFFFGLLTCVQAQDKYDYAVITLTLKNNTITISINGKEHKKNKVKVSSSHDATPALNEISKMNEDGWEVYSSNGNMPATYSVYYFFLKKKVS